MLDFQRIHFSRKGLENVPALFAQLNCESKSFEPDHQILSQCPIQRFLTVITHFFESLKSKRRWLFKNNKLNLKIFWFQALRKPRFENKENFWINCVCIKAFVSWYIHKGAFAFIAYLQEDIHVMAYSQVAIHIMACTNGTFASWHTHKRALTSLHTHKEAFASWHTYKGTFTSWHTHKGAFASWHTY